MGIRSYTQIAEEVRALNIPTLKRVYSYAETPYVNTYERFFRWFQDELLENVYGFTKPYFVFRDATEINAYAYSQLELIAFNKGLIDYLMNIFGGAQNVFKEPEFVDYEKRVYGIFNSAPWALLEFSLNFIFAHELGHLLQKFGDTKEFSELSSKKAAEQSIVEQASEYDADYLGAMFLVLRVKKFVEQLPEPEQDVNALMKFLTLAIAGIYPFWLQTADKREIYYEGYTHPHPIVRLIYFSEMISNIVPIQTKFESIDPGQLMRDVYKLSFRMLNGGIKDAITLKDFVKANSEKFYDHISLIRNTAFDNPFSTKNTFLVKATKPYTDKEDSRK